MRQSLFSIKCESLGFQYYTFTILLCAYVETVYNSVNIRLACHIAIHVCNTFYLTSCLFTVFQWYSCCV